MKTILIIGAGPGIGAATAERFGREGWHVVLAARSASKLDHVANALRADGVAAETRTVDARDEAAIAAIVEEVAANSSGLDTVHFNAAAMTQAGVLDQSTDAMMDDLAVSIGGAVAVLRTAGQVMAERGSGTILLTGGALALQPSNDLLSLSIGKAGIRALAHAVFDDFAARGVHVATVTVGAMIRPGSREAAGVADAFWALQAQSRDAWSWEASYPT